MTYHNVDLPSDESTSLLPQPAKSYKQQAFDIVEGNTKQGKWFNGFIMVLILLNVLLFFATTTKDFYHRHKWALEFFEFISVVVFTAEYALRVYIAPLKYEKMAHGMARTMFCCSFFGIIDLMGFLPYWLTIFFPEARISLALIRVLRIVRVFRAEGQYFEAFTLFDDVYRANVNMLIVTGFTGSVVWLFIGDLYYLTERNNSEVEGKFSNMFNSMWWTLVNLNGEFPINEELTPWGKVVAIGTVIVAVGVFAIPTGILGSGLKDIYDKKREEAANEEEEDSMEVATTEEICRVCLEKEIEEMPLQERTWAHMEGRTWLGRMIDYFMLVLIILNVVAFSYSTIPGFHHKSLLDAFEAFSVIIFTVEFLFNLWSCVAEPKYSGPYGRLEYVMSFYGMVDLLTVLPWWVDIFYPGDIMPTTFVRSFRLIKLFRSDIETFALFGEVYRMQKDMIMTAGFIGFILWVCFAAVMHFSERHNPDAEVRDEFQSGGGAAWIVLLNLTGEYPIADYTLLGRLLCVVSSICAIGVFAIPTGICADGFGAVMDERDEKAEKRANNPVMCLKCQRNVDEMNGVKLPVGLDKAVEVVLKEAEEDTVELVEPPETLRQWVFQILNSKTELGDLVEKATLAVIVLNIVCFIISTEKSVMKAHPSWVGWFDTIEWITMILFTAEYGLRIWSCVENPKLHEPTCLGDTPHINHATSFYSIVDLLAILPFWIDVALPSINIMPTTIFRIFRLIKLLKGEKYAPAFTLLDDVFVAKRLVLACTGVVAAIMIIFFATLLHYTEMDNHVKVENLTMAQRFQDVPHALFYTMLHLTGDYPLYQYTVAGRVVNFFMIIAAAGLIGIPTGIIADGFQKLIEELKKREAELKGEQDDDEIEIRTGVMDTLCAVCRVEAAESRGMESQVYVFLNGDTQAGAFFIKVIFTTIIVNMCFFFLQTDKPVANQLGHDLFNIVEYFSGFLFTVEYFLRIYAAPGDPDYNSRWEYATSFLAIVDLLAVLPFYISLITGTVSGWSMVLRSFRLIRILKFEHYMEAFTMFDNVLAQSRGVIVTTSLSAAIVWVVCATLFWMFEGDNPLSDGKFASVPSSLFYTMLFLGGEWAVCDFSIWGQLLGVFMCIVGIGIFAVPTGVLYSGFEELIQKREEILERRKTAAKCANCSQAIKHFIHHRTQDEDDD